MTGMFRIIEGETAIVRCNGLFKEAKVAVRAGGELFVQINGGFARLYADGSTSLGSRATLDTLTFDADLHADRFNRLCVGAGEGRKPLAAPAIERLLGVTDEKG